MDPITQGALGAAAALALAGTRSPLSRSLVAWIGAAGGMAPDLDVFIRSADDPLLAIEYHRHFTHSLAFIPIGGPLVALPLLVFERLRRHARWTMLLSTAGYATHALLDACTTYGTLLLWPFSEFRVSWSVISVVDPLFTLPLLAAVLVSVWRRSQRSLQFGIAWGALYLCLGLVQQSRAREAQRAIADLRGHVIERSAVFPSIANNVTWRSVYQSDGRFHVDKIRLGWARSCVSPGQSVPVVPPLELKGLAPKVARGERLIRWFAGDWVAYDPREPDVLGDLRYSLAPNGVRPIWGIRRAPRGTAAADATSVEWVNNNREREVGWAAFSRLVLEDDPGARCF